MKLHRTSRLAALGGTGLALACGTRVHVAARTPALTLAPTCAEVLGAAFGANDAERKARAIAIWMPSDTARVREACTGR